MLVSYVVSVVVVAAFSFFGIYVSAASPLWYLDLPSAAVVLIPAFVLGAGDYGWYGLAAAFSAAFGSAPKNGATLREAAAAARALGRYAWYAAAMGTFIGAIAILGGIGAAGSVARLGSNVSIALICAFYALLFNFLLIRPMLNRLDRKLRDGEGSDTEPEA